ncbi:unnamed protein product [Peronospora belbahrii]|uniref:Uncharacterized protein n=1 Tax=Peronospora belbahrii TaxID=622444 RepID=A0AAU9L222_9STRA|nr:unnamed protein product [Peronospora belbahrii]
MKFMQEKMKSSPLLTEQMRAATREVHSISDKLVNVKLMVALMDKKLYGRALMLFYYIYKIFHEIARADNIAKDLHYYLGEEWSTKYQPTQAVQDYVKTTVQNGTVRVS